VLVEVADFEQPTSNPPNKLTTTIPINTVDENFFTYISPFSHIVFIKRLIFETSFSNSMLQHLPGLNESRQLSI
jgi:hypothetical protein